MKTQNPHEDIKRSRVLLEKLLLVKKSNQEENKKIEALKSQIKRLSEL